MKSYITASAAAACLLLASSCAETPHDDTALPATRISVTASLSNSTRAEYDDNTRRMYWSAGDALRVAAFSEGERIEESSGRVWSLFDMDMTNGLDREYMTFAGDALLPAGVSDMIDERLYALYPAAMASDTSHTLRFPAVQRYVADSFDTAAALLLSEPLPVSVLPGGTAQAAGTFRFAHYTGYLSLIPVDMPSEVADERVGTITLQSPGRAVAGDFTVAIDDATAQWTLSETDCSDSVTLDFSDNDITVGELGEFRFALLPGDYGEITLTINTVEGSSMVMNRSGLRIESGVIAEQDIHFTADDTLLRKAAIEISAGTTDIGSSYSSATKTVKIDDIDFSYVYVRSVSSDTCLEIGNRSRGEIWNTAPIPGKVVSVTVNCAENHNARYIKVEMGDSSDSYGHSQMGTADRSVTYAAPSDADLRYIRLSNTGSSTNVQVESISVLYVAEV